MTEEKYEVVRCDKCAKEIPEALVNWRDPYADVHIMCKECYKKCQK